MKYVRGFTTTKQALLEHIARFAQSCGWSASEHTHVYEYNQYGANKRYEHTGYWFSNAKGSEFYITTALTSGYYGYDLYSWLLVTKKGTQDDAFFTPRDTPIIHAFKIAYFQSNTSFSGKLEAEERNNRGHEYFIVGDEHTLALSLNNHGRYFSFFILSEVEKSYEFSGGSFLLASELRQMNNPAFYKFRDYDPIPQFRDSPSISGDLFLGHRASLTLGDRRLWLEEHRLDRAQKPKWITNITAAHNNGAKYLGVDTPEFFIHPQSSEYSGIAPLITPHFFLLNPLGRYYYAGGLKDVALLPLKGLAHGSEIYYGDERFLILNSTYQERDASSPYYLNNYGWAFRL